MTDILLWLNIIDIFKFISLHFKHTYQDCRMLIKTLNSVTELVQQIIYVYKVWALFAYAIASVLIFTWDFMVIWNKKVLKNKLF